MSSSGTVDMRKAERDERTATLATLVRVYRRNSDGYFREHAKVKGAKGCPCRFCAEHERLERLWPQYVFNDGTTN